jgi:hypothetical protein
MTTLLVERPDVASDIGYDDYEPLTAVYIAPQACGGRGAGCLSNAMCCKGLTCHNAAPVHDIVGTCG